MSVEEVHRDGRAGGGLQYQGLVAGVLEDAGSDARDEAVGIGEVGTLVDLGDRTLVDVENGLRDLELGQCEGHDIVELDFGLRSEGELDLYEVRGDLRDGEVGGCCGCAESEVLGRVAARPERDVCKVHTTAEDVPVS